MMIQIPTNVALLRQILVSFIRNEVEKVGVRRVVVGLSGGVDSSLSAMLAAEALTPKNVLGIMMPYESSSPESLAHAELVVKKGSIESLTVDITPQIDAYFERFPEADQKRRGNKMARERMTILYDHSARWNALVLGTSNKTELLLGYGTLYGDMASAINPLGDLYKTRCGPWPRRWGCRRSLCKRSLLPTSGLDRPMRESTVSLTAKWIGFSI